MREETVTPFGLHRDAWGRLVLTLEGEEHAGVEPARAFPLSAPRHGMAILSAAGRELVWVDDAEAVPAPQRRLLEEELALRDFVPMLVRIVRVSAGADPSRWEVETDRGPTSFLLNSGDDVHLLGEGRALITDASGVRYLVPDVEALDPASRRLLERYL
jgi:hypothetical protein